MAVYSYKAFEGASPVSGTLAADSPRAARDALRDRGLTIQNVTQQRDRAAASGSAFRLPTFSTRTQSARVAAFTRELSTLLAVGIPLLEALDTLIRQHKGGFANALLRLRDRVAGGASLADAMAEQPELFDELATSMVRVGESAGTLELVLEQLADFKERSAALRNRITTALIYPAIVLCMAVAVSIFLMTFVVPQLLAGLLEAGRPLPFATRVVKALSDGLLGWWWLLLLVAVAAGVGLTLALRTPAGRLRWHRLQLRIPLLGDLTRKQAITRVSVVMASLLRSGIVFDAAVRIAARATPNLVLRDALLRVETAVTGGREISLAIEQTGAFPPLVVQVFSVGQDSGRLEEMLDRLAKDYDAQVALAAGRFTAVLEPVLILALVFIVGFIAFATVLPILEAGNVL